LQYDLLLSTGVTVDPNVSRGTNNPPISKTVMRWDIIAMQTTELDVLYIASSVDYEETRFFELGFRSLGTGGSISIKRLLFAPRRVVLSLFMALSAFPRW
jgi:hypothetical protein